MKSNITAFTAALITEQHWPDLTDAQADEVVNKLWEDGSIERLLKKYLTCGAWEKGSFENETKSLCENATEDMFPHSNDPYSEDAS